MSLMLLNNTELAYTIVGMALIQTSVINSIISINNPISETTALEITMIAGGVSAHLVIKQITGT